MDDFFRALNAKGVGHVWHVWINREASRLHEWEKDHPTGETTTETRRGKEVQVPTKPRTPLDLIDPHGRNLYGFKRAVNMLGWLGRRITKDRKKTLPLVHQQCSHSAPETMDENHLECWLGQKVATCPILQRLRETFAQESKGYYADITEAQIDQIAAATCVWHLLMGQDGFVDWEEGAIQDTSDRKFWKRVYDNLSS